MLPTQLRCDKFNSAATGNSPAYTAGADLDAQNSWAKLAGAATSDFFVVASALIEGDQLVAFRNAAAGNTGYEKSAGATRTAGTDFWRVVWQFMVKPTASVSDEMWLTLSAGAGSLGPLLAGNNAVTVAVKLDAGGVNVDLYVNEQAGITTYDQLFPASATVPVTLRMDIEEQNTFALYIDANNDGMGWVPVHRGTLKTGNEALSRVQIGANAGTSTDDTLEFDNLTITKITADTPINLGERKPRSAAIVAGGIVMAPDGLTATLTIAITDAITGTVVAPSRERPVPASYVDPGSEALLNTELEEELKKYDREVRCAALAGNRGW